MTKARPAAAAKQVQVDTAAYERIVELAETAHCTMAHAASLLVCVADFDAAVNRHCSEVMETAAARGAGKPAAAPASSRPASAAAAPPRDASGQPAASSRPASAAAPPRDASGQPAASSRPASAAAPPRDASGQPAASSRPASAAAPPREGRPQARPHGSSAA